MKLRSAINRFALAGTFIAVLALSACNGGSSNGSKDSAANSSAGMSDDNSLLGAGSTFVNPLFSKMFAEYSKSAGINVNYQSIGSGGGILQLTNKTIDFGDSDAPLNDDQAKKMGSDVLHIPMCAGAVVMSYNLPELKGTLKLTPDVLAQIFLGKIKVWNDKQIAAINPGLLLPSQDIFVVHRADGSGTTNIFTGYLAKVSPDWAKSPGKGSAINWPAGIGGKGNEGVAGLVKQTPGGIGYIELAYAMQNNMTFADIRNKSGNFVRPQ